MCDVAWPIFRLDLLKDSLSLLQHQCDTPTNCRFRRQVVCDCIVSNIKNVRTSNAQKGVVRLEIPLHPEVDPKSCTEWTTVDVPEEIVRCLQQRNRIHFTQAHGTPFTVPLLSDHLGFCGDGVQSDHILNGTHDLSSYSDSVRLLLRHMQYTQEMAEDTSRPTISDEVFTDKLKVWTESTTTSPSGIHLGHYKVLIGRHSFSSDAPDEELTSEFRDR